MVPPCVQISKDFLLSGSFTEQENHFYSAPPHSSLVTTQVILFIAIKRLFSNRPVMARRKFFQYEQKAVTAGVTTQFKLQNDPTQYFQSDLTGNSLLVWHMLVARATKHCEKQKNA